MGTATKPAIVILGDASRDRIVDEFEARYARDYDIVAPTMSDARSLLAGMGAAHHPVAMIVCEHRVGAYSALAVLRRLQPVLATARRVVMVASTDFRDAAGALRDAQAAGHLDGYFVIPRGPRDEEFHAGVTDLLSEWTWVSGAVSIEIVRVVMDAPTPESAQAIDFLERMGVPTRVHAPDSLIGREVLAEAGPDAALPVIQLVGGPTLSRPTVRQLGALMESYGASTDPLTVDETVDLLIVGAGPAGLAAAVYGASEGLTTLVIEAEAVGGQAGTSSMIRNYLGFPRGISGMRLAQRARVQAVRFGARFVSGCRVDALELGDGPEPVHSMHAGDRVFSGRAVVIATGVAYRRLGVPAIEELVGRGVNYGAATSTARDMRGRHVYVVGGGNSAGQAAVHLARFAASVTVVVRRPDLTVSMSDYLIRELQGRPGITVRPCTEVVDGGGDGVLEWLTLRDLNTGARERVEASGLYLLLGADPHCGWLPDEVCRDDHGFVLAGRDVPQRFWVDGPPMSLATAVPGVFVAGDVRAGSMKRVAAATGEGASVVPLVHTYLGDG